VTEAIDLPGRTAALVQSFADPTPDSLLLVRAVLQRQPELKALFLQFRSEGRAIDWLRDMLAPAVAARVPELSFDNVVEACAYLADEYHQLGEGYFIVSQDTGRVAFVLTEEDLYDPGLLTRDSGIVGQALRRINPSLEAAIVSSYHDRGRETLVLERLRERAHQTTLLREDGDRRLRIATRAGRREMARELSEDDPWRLLQRASGTTGMFLRHFELTERYEGPLDCIEGVACCRSVLGLQDMLTSNLAYDRLGVLRGSAPQAWIRDIARQLSNRARARNTKTLPITVDDLSDELLASRELWVVDPDVFELMRRARGRVVPVEGAEPLGFSGRVGYLVVSNDFGVESREIADVLSAVRRLAPNRIPPLARGGSRCNPRGPR
jgi:hypothetical protein